jgi:hypothetical protein
MTTTDTVRLREGWTREEHDAYMKYLSDGYADTDGYWGPLHPDSWVAGYRRSKGGAMLFKLEIELGNESMQTPADVGEAIARTLANHGRAQGSMFDSFGTLDSGTMLDRNGNTVGRWEIVVGIT